MTSAIQFSTIDVTRQVFYKMDLTYAVVNLFPILPGHALVVPTRVVSRLIDLTDAELIALTFSVRRVGSILQRAYKADGLTIVLQDGKSAGQTVPHLHFHVLPRGAQGDRFSDKNEAIYPELEAAEASLSANIREKEAGQKDQSLKVDADKGVKPRTMEDMIAETQWLKGFSTEEDPKL